MTTLIKLNIINFFVAHFFVGKVPITEGNPTIFQNTSLALLIQLIYSLGEQHQTLKKIDRKQSTQTDAWSNRPAM